MKTHPYFQPPPPPLSAVPSDRPPRFQTTLRIDLRRFAVRERVGPGYDFSRFEQHASEQVAQLPPGSTVDLVVHSYRPVPGRLGFADPRMIWNICTDDMGVAAHWRAGIRAASGWDDPEGGSAA
ncbi:hypothetical protein [Arthrobacter sp.]|uniref:hypothetical protein n=1 Tax=Arthrobacter sp. TaxID=1667 RepID=UPI002811D809|nr:hypothetical protein [Arthrobacter sp.]